MATARYITSVEFISVCPDYLKIQLLDDDHDGSEDVGLADQLIEDAADEVDSYLSLRYAVPFSTTDPPKLVKHATKWIAWYNAHLRRGMMKQMVQTRYDAIIEMLTGAANPGSADISIGMGEDPDPAENSTVIDSVIVGSYTRVMTRPVLTATSTGY